VDDWLHSREVCVRVHSTVVTFTILAASLRTVQAARGECVLVPVQDVAGREDVRFIFKGTPASITPIEGPQLAGLKVTFDVNWVWKGTPGQRVELYMDLSSNNPHFAAGDAAIVFVKSMDRDVQRRLGITATDTSVLTVVPCTGFWSETEITAALGAGEAPRKERESLPSGTSASPFNAHNVTVRRPGPVRRGG
jgi:hypothetical protein